MQYSLKQMTYSIDVVNSIKYILCGYRLGSVVLKNPSPVSFKTDPKWTEMMSQLTDETLTLVVSSKEC